MELRPYQLDVIERLSAGFRAGHTRQLLCMATGSGKTATAGAMILRAAERGNRSLFVVERIELANQAVRHLESLGLSVGVLQGENTYFTDQDHAIVASIQTLASRGVPDRLKLIVLDEAHIVHKAHEDLLSKRNLIPAIGLSATPLRAGLGRIYTNLVKGPRIGDLVKDGFLVPVQAFGPTQDKITAAVSGVGDRKKPGGRDFIKADLAKALNRKELIGDIVATWRTKAEGLPTLVFAVDIAHSKAIVDDFLAEGVAAEHVDGYSDEDERRATIDRFRRGETTVLSSVNVLGIGFDVPTAACAVLARPTLSLALHIQQVGRVMRPAPGKTHALVLDHAGNFARHGRPEDFDVEVLDDGEIGVRAKRKVSEELSPCSSCGFLLERSRRECPSCGHERRRVADVTVLDGELVEFGGQERIKVELDRRNFFLELRQVGIDRDWSPKAAAAQYRERFGEWPPHAWLAYRPREPEQATLRWVKSRMIAFAKNRSRQAA
jgi:superfamily II DNA or RNA helicase